MAFYHSADIGTYHLNEVKPARVVPGHERHKWNSKPGWGESTTCKKCGCVKHRRRADYVETYRMPGGELTSERPTCPGIATKVALNE